MLVVLCLAASAAMTRPAVQLSRRAAVLSAISLPACALADEDTAARAPQITTAAQRTLGALNAGSRKLSDENVAEGDLMAELLRRTVRLEPLHGGGLPRGGRYYLLLN